MQHVIGDMSRSAHSHWLLRVFHWRQLDLESSISKMFGIYDSRSGGSNSYESSKIIALTPHTSGFLDKQSVVTSLKLGHATSNCGGGANWALNQAKNPLACLQKLLLAPATRM